MKVRLWHILVVVSFMFAGHFTAVAFNLYAKTPLFVDGPLHFLGGVLLGMIWLFILDIIEEPITSNLLFAASIIGFALFGSVLWEVFEFTLSHAYPTLAWKYRLLSFSVDDLLSDVLLGFSGGAVVAIYSLKTK